MKNNEDYLPSALLVVTHEVIKTKKTKGEGQGSEVGFQLEDEIRPLSCLSLRT